MTRMLVSAALCGLMSIAAAFAADSEWTEKAINNPADMWGIWGNAQSEIVADPDVEGGKAKRVVISPKPQNPWDVGGYVLITKPVKKGDVILLAFWARAERLPAGDDFIETSARIHDTSPENASVTPETQFLIGTQWKLFHASGTADKDYAVGKLGCGMLLGSDDQIIDFGPAYIVDYGPGYDLSKLPQN
jgi:hypothetical protein